MKKTNIIKKNFDISKVLDSKKGYRNRYFNVYYNENNVGKYRFAVCVSKKIGNAVTRNKVKRQVKDVIDKSNLVFNSNTDYVIIIKKEINEIKYSEIKQKFNGSIKESNRLGENYEKKQDNENISCSAINIYNNWLYNNTKRSKN